MLAQIISLQQRLEDFCGLMRSFIVLLDVPPGLSQRQILRWRTAFQSAFAACYHPWLKVARRDDARDVLVSIPPSSTAAGLIARSEFLFGVPHGPANLLAAEVVHVNDVVSPSRHDELHPAGINVYLRERDGVRLTAARTLSSDRSYRQLSVRRLITMICRTLEQQTQWMVFEPNNASLRAEVRALLTGFLRSLGKLGAFQGATEAESFFVRCDDSLNTPADVDAGRIIAEIGVAPAEPIEFIVLRFSRDADGSFTAEK
jgi:phage tail sheath protein FI